MWDQLIHQLLPHCQLQPGLSCSTAHHLSGSANHYLAASPLRPSYPSPPLLPIWVNVSSLTPWLSDFYTVRFSVSSGCFLFFNLLSFFRLCEEAQCVYLCLHLGRKSLIIVLISHLRYNIFSSVCKPFLYFLFCELPFHVLPTNGKFFSFLSDHTITQLPPPVYF